MIMSIGSRATGSRDQMGGLLTGQGSPPSLLHAIMQHQVKPPFGKALRDVLDGRLRNRKGLGNLSFIPAVSQFQHDPGSRESARVGLALSSKPLGLGPLRFAERQ